ncbi:MAG: AmmeMemoRadiSam system radical SAM enzyme [Candidatus Omnitrophica bacterium]|nr:AmmeMemoRadiSam system radical SAM enzyme [Candidatus Omnitrophota bacterium]
MKEALLYKKLADKIVICNLCAHYCKINQGKFGFCKVRENIEGILYTHAYGKVIASQADPIEKKPLYHFLPGSSSFSIATIGCNFRCAFCQNWEISQKSFQDGNILGGGEFTPEEIIKEAEVNQCLSISYTYTEPTIFFEYALDTAKLAKARGLRNVFVTNGYMSKECLELIHPYLDAANVDLKFFKDSSYKKICSSSLQPVLDSIKLMHKLGIWVEVTTLVVPGENDSPKELEDIACFLANLDRNIPWHLSRFHPDYKFTEHEVTPEVTLKQAEEIGRKSGLNYVYVGNVFGWPDNSHCPGCKKVVIRREGFNVVEYALKKNKCSYCDSVIPGIFAK